LIATVRILDTTTLGEIANEFEYVHARSAVVQVLRQDKSGAWPLQLRLGFARETFGIDHRWRMAQRAGCRQSASAPSAAPAGRAAAPSPAARTAL
jgi:hypothetical protein